MQKWQMPSNALLVVSANGSLLICHRDTRSRSSPLTCSLHGSSENIPVRRLSNARTQAELAVGFGRKVRNLVDTEITMNIFPDLSLAADSKAAGRWNTSKGGDYFAIGVGGAVTGKGADVLIIDDPHSEQEAAIAETNPDIYDKTYEWYTSGPRQRLQPGGCHRQS
jgi:hypothetical protein